MKKRTAIWILAVALVLVSAVAVLAIAGLHKQDRIIDGLHARYVQACIMGSDEDQNECEGRWNRAVKP